MALMFRGSMYAALGQAVRRANSRLYSNALMVHDYHVLRGISVFTTTDIATKSLAALLVVLVACDLEIQYRNISRSLNV